MNNNWHDYMRKELIERVCRRFKELSPEKIAYVKILCSVIMQAAADMHLHNVKNKASAKKYFNGDLFQKHCQELCIDSDGILEMIAYVSLQKSTNNESK